MTYAPLLLRTVLVQGSGDISLSGAAIAVVTALLTAVAGALGYVFRMYLEQVNNRILDLRKQIDEKQKEVEYWRGLAEQSVRISEAVTGELRQTRERDHGRGA